MKNMTELQAAAQAGKKAKKEAKKSEAVSAMDDSGQTIDSLAEKLNASAWTLLRYLTELVQEGRIFRVLVSNKFQGLPMRGKTFQYFLTVEAAASRLKESDEFTRANRKAYESQRNDMERIKRQEFRKTHPRAKSGPKPKKMRSPTQRQADDAHRLARQRYAEQASYKPKGDNTPAVPPEGQSIKDLGGFTGRSRYEPDPDFVGFFSQHKPGQYVLQPTSAAARALA